MEWFTTIGKARTAAMANATRDGVAWVILRSDTGNRTYNYDGNDDSSYVDAKTCNFCATDEYDGSISNYTLIDTIGNNTKDLDPNELNITLTKDQWTLVKEMLDIDDVEADLAIDNPVKKDLLQRLMGKL